MRILSRLKHFWVAALAIVLLLPSIFAVLPTPAASAADSRPFSVASNNVTYGTVSGNTSGTAVIGQSITVTATPNAGYQFYYWEISHYGGSSWSQINNLSAPDPKVLMWEFSYIDINNGTGTLMFRASFAPIPTGSSSFSAAVDDIARGYLTGTNAGGGVVSAGSTVTFNIHARSGWAFDSAVLQGSAGNTIKDLTSYVSGTNPATLSYTFTPQDIAASTGLVIKINFKSAPPTREPASEAPSTIDLYTWTPGGGLSNFSSLPAGYTISGTADPNTGTFAYDPNLTWTIGTNGQTIDPSLTFLGWAVMGVDKPYPSNAPGSQPTLPNFTFLAGWDSTINKFPILKIGTYTQYFFIPGLSTTTFFDDFHPVFIAVFGPATGPSLPSNMVNMTIDSTIGASGPVTSVPTGTAMASGSYAKGTYTLRPSTPITGYTFVGWTINGFFDSRTLPTADLVINADSFANNLTIVAIYLPANPNISFNISTAAIVNGTQQSTLPGYWVSSTTFGSTVNIPVNLLTDVAYINMLSLPVPSNLNLYPFVGWYVGTTNNFSAATLYSSSQQLRIPYRDFIGQSSVTLYAWAVYDATITNLNLAVYSPNASYTVSPTTPQIGSPVTITATPDTGYTVYRWIVDGITIQTGSNSFTHTFNNTSALLQIDCVPFGALDLLVISPFGSYTLNPITPAVGQPVTITIIPNGGYEVTSFRVSPNAEVIPATGNTFTHTFWSLANAWIEINYTLTSGYYPVSVELDTSVGYLWAVLEGGGVAHQPGDTVTIIGTPNYPQYVGAWYDKATGVLVSNSNSYTFTMTAQARTFEFRLMDILAPDEPLTEYELKFGINLWFRIKDGDTLTRGGSEWVLSLRTDPRHYDRDNLVLSVISGTGTIEWSTAGNLDYLNFTGLTITGYGLVKYEISDIHSNLKITWTIQWSAELSPITEIFVRFGVFNSQVVGNDDTYNIDKSMQEYSVRTTPSRPVGDQIVAVVLDGDGSISVKPSSGANTILQARGTGLVTYQVSNEDGSVAVTWSVNWGNSPSGDGWWDKLMAWIGGITVSTLVKVLMIVAIIVLIILVLANTTPWGRSVKKSTKKFFKK